LGPLWSGLLGACLGLAITWLTVPKANRRWIDWLAGALTGAAITLTIWASAAVLAVWLRLRFRDQPNRPDRSHLLVMLLMLAVVHFAIVFGVCKGLMYWLSTST